MAEGEGGRLTCRRCGSAELRRHDEGYRCQDCGLVFAFTIGDAVRMEPGFFERLRHEFVERHGLSVGMVALRTRPPALEPLERGVAGLSTKRATNWLPRVEHALDVLEEVERLVTRNMGESWRPEL